MNIELQEELIRLQSSLEVLMDKYNKASEMYNEQAYKQQQILQVKDNVCCKLINVLKKFSPLSLLSTLTVYSEDLEEKGIDMTDDLFANQIDVNTFIEEYVKLRKEYHLIQQKANYLRR